MELETMFPICPARPLKGFPVQDDALSIKPGSDQTVRVKVNKETHEVRFDAESENEVTVTIKPKD
jgi:hypothetical protein